MGITLCIAACFPGCADAPDGATAPPVPDRTTPAEEIELLKITVGEPTKLTSMSYQNTSEVVVSRTGVVAALYPKPPREVKKYRVSKDGGKA
jgi:hypothetical protein